MSQVAPYEYVIRTCPLLLWVKLDNGTCFNIPLYNIPISYLKVLSFALLYRYITCSPVFDDETAGACLKVTHQSPRCPHTQSTEVDEGPDQKPDTQSHRRNEHVGRKVP